MKIVRNGLSTHRPLARTHRGLPRAASGGTSALGFRVCGAAWIAMELTGWYVIVPLALASLLTGLVMSLGTKWGLFRHYWVLFSLVLTVFATTILLLHMPDVSTIAEVAREADDASLGGLGGDLLHPGVGLLVLLVIQGLNVYKPRGMTPYGWRKQHEQHTASSAVDGAT